MTNKELQEKLREFPDDLEVRMGASYGQTVPVMSPTTSVKNGKEFIEL
nr:hypothetical protein G8766_04210 [Lactococcus garvieae]